MDFWGHLENWQIARLLTCMIYLFLLIDMEKIQPLVTVTSDIYIPLNLHEWFDVINQYSNRSGMQEMC